MRGKLVIGVIGVALLATACGSKMAGPLAPEAVPTTPIAISYAINLPDAGMVNNMKLAYPSGITDMTPLQAQEKFDYTVYYGTPNVYSGESVEAPGSKMAGILTAPIGVALEDDVPGSEWAAMESRTATILGSGSSRSQGGQSEERSGESWYRWTPLAVLRLTSHGSRR